MPQNDGWEDVKLGSSGDAGWEDYSPPKQYQDQPSLFSRAMSYDVPLIDITPATNWMSQKFEEYTKPRQLSTFEQSVMRGFPGLAQIQDFIDPGKTGSTAPFRTLGSELIKDTGEVASGLTTPSNIAATVATYGAYGAARAGLAPAIPKALTWAARAASVPTTVHGGSQIAEGLGGDEINWQQVGMGAGELAGGLAGTFEPIPRGRSTVPEVKPFTDAVEATSTPDPIAPEPVVPANISGKMPQIDRGADGLPNVVVKSNWTAGEIQFFRSKGYESGGVSPQGLPYMIRKGTEDPYTGGLIDEPQATPEQLMDQLRASVQRDQQAATVKGESVPFNDEEGFTLPQEAVTKAKIEALEAQGYEQVGLDDAGNSIFKRLLSDEEGGLSLVPEDWNRGFDDLMGRFRGPQRPSVDPRFARRLEESGTTEFDFTGANEPVQPGLPMPMEVRQRNRLEDIGNARMEPDMRQMSFDDLSSNEPQAMMVKGYNEGSTGLPNVAMGGADPRVLDVLGTALYTRRRPITATKELLQNAFDEHKIAGVNQPVKVLFQNNTLNPQTQQPAVALTVRDKGRGVQPDQIYTVLTDIGKTGKADEASAAGGFGLAKASPFLGGKFVEVRSVVDTPEGRKVFTFRGNPAEFKNQARGVPLDEAPADGLPTGMEVTTYYAPDTEGFYGAQQWARNMAEMSPSHGAGIKYAELNAGIRQDEVRAWLDDQQFNAGVDPNASMGTRIRQAKSGVNQVQAREKLFQPQEFPEVQDTINLPGSQIDIRYQPNTKGAPTQADIFLANKGMYQGKTEAYFGGELEGAPSRIVADIKALVEEGHDDYPFAANREQVNQAITNAIDQWVNENIVSRVTKKLLREVQEQYDTISMVNKDSLNKYGHEMYAYDDGNRFAPDELVLIHNSQKYNEALTFINQVSNQILSVADEIGWQPESWGMSWKKPSERLKKLGILYQGPDTNGAVTFGIHIPRPDDLNNSAILLNVFEMMNKANSKAAYIDVNAPGVSPIDDFATQLFTTIAHEQAHIPGGGHDTNFAYRDAALRARLGASDTIGILSDIKEVFGNGTGGFSPELSGILSVYNGSRGRAASSSNAILATGTGSRGRSAAKGPEGSNLKGTGSGGTKPPSTPTGGSGPTGGGGRNRSQPSALREAYNLPRAATTTADLSAAMRQGLPLIFRKEWWKAWNQQVQALGSEGAYQKTLSDLRARPIFQSRIDMSTGKVTKSFAEQVGMTLSDIKGDFLTKREESVASNWIESGKMFGPLAPVYQKTLGRVARASNRAYTAFLNQLRADTFEALLKDAEAIYMQGKDGAKNPYTDLTFAREIADFVNTATGRGPLKTALPTIHEGRIGLKERSLEQNAKLLTDAIFSPRLMASRVRMLNPLTYSMASPFVRKQYVKALLSVGAAWGSIASLAAGAGADVSLDPNSADFGKIRIGDTRIDPAAGFQQYLVAATRLLSGRTTSSRTGSEQELGQGYRAETRKDVGERFLANKLHPVLKFAYDLAFASEYQPFQVGDRAIQMFVPLIIQDVVELAEQDPDMLPLIGPIAIGMGTQTYGKGESTSKFVPKESDWVFTGGAPENEMPDWMSQALE